MNVAVVIVDEEEYLPFELALVFYSRFFLVEYRLSFYDELSFSWLKLRFRSDGVFLLLCSVVFVVYITSTAD